VTKYIYADIFVTFLEKDGGKEASNHPFRAGDVAWQVVTGTSEPWQICCCINCFLW